MKKLFIIIILGVFCVLLGAQDSLLVKDKILDEVSGIVCGLVNPDLYYVINDSGGKPEVYGLNSKGKLKTILKLNNIVNRDWEDIAAGPGPESGKKYIYVAETGDNDAKYPEIWLYRFKEPVLAHKHAGKGIRTMEINGTQKLKIQYADGAKDCESVFIDPLNGDVYLVSKREQKVGLYLVKAPLDTAKVNIARRVMSFSFPLAVAADISPSRDNVLIKTYTDIYSWKVEPGEEMISALSKEPVKLPYIVEPQGESICFSADEKSYVTLSEKHEGVPLHLYIYRFLK